MDSLNLLIPVSVVVVMTETFRSQIIAEAEESIQQLEDTLSRIAAVESPEGEEGDLERARLAAEQARLLHRRGELEWRIKEARSVKAGAEIPFQELQATVEVKPGDDFHAKTRAQILVKDGQVVAIRRS